MQHEESFPAFIAAGAGKGSIPICEEEPYKPLVKLKGKPLVQYSIEAALSAKRINSIWLWGDKERLENLVDSMQIDDSERKSIHVVQQKGNLFESFFSAFYEYMQNEGYPSFEGSPMKKKDVTRYIEMLDDEAVGKKAMILSCDSPIINPDNINQFIDICSHMRDEIDLFWGYGTKGDFKRWTDDMIGLKDEDYTLLNLNFMTMAGGEYRVNNMILARPMSAMSKCSEFLDIAESLYEKRYQTKGKNMLSIARDILGWQFKRGGTVGERINHILAVPYALRVVLPALMSQRLNKGREHSVKTIFYGINTIESIVSKEFCPTKIVIDPNPQSMLDMDTPDSKEWMEKHYDTLVASSKNFKTHSVYIPPGFNRWVSEHYVASFVVTFPSAVATIGYQIYTAYRPRVDNFIKSLKKKDGW